MSELLADWDDHLVRVIMAGNGNPYQYLTPLRKQLIWALHHRYDVAHLMRLFALPLDRIRDELVPLVDAHLVREHRGAYEPTFFIADAAETAQVTHHAQHTSRALAAYCVQQWHYLQQRFEELLLESHVSFTDLAFFLVGARVLDVGVLDSLARDASLMPPAPSRPSPDNADARYYFWMVNGSYEQLGHYGQRATSLPWNHWYLPTFGQYEMNGQPNRHRTQFEAYARTSADDHSSRDALALATTLTIPGFTPQQSKQWTEHTRVYTDAITAIYHQQLSGILTLYSGLKSGMRRPENFGEFFCWYHHVAYAHAIDHLVESEKIRIPEHRYTAAIWYEEPEHKTF